MDDIMKKFNLYFLDVVKGQYADFKGRTAKKNFWMYVLFNIVLSILVIIIASAIHFSFLNTIFSLALLAPSVGIGIRRMHDVGKSGWFILIPIYNIILAIGEGETEENKWGAVPQDEETNETE